MARTYLKSPWTHLVVLGLTTFFATALIFSQIDRTVADDLPDEIIVKPGDTLSKIAKKYLDDPLKWYILMKFNNIDDPNLIFPGTKLQISDVLRSGEIIKGKVIFATPKQSTYTYMGATLELQDGSEVPPEGKIETKNGIVTIKMPDKSNIQVAKNSIMKVGDLFANQDEGTVYSFFELVKGKVRANVSELAAGSKFEVRAKSAVAGVRGTDFEIRLPEGSDEMQLATFDGAVALKSLETGAAVEVSAGTGIKLNLEANEFSKPRELLPAVQNAAYRQNPDGSFTFFWEPVSGAVEYAFYIAEDRNFERNQLVGTFNRTSIKFSQFPTGRLFVRIDAIDEFEMSSQPAKPLMMMVE